MRNAATFDTRVHLIVGPTHIERYGVQGVVDIAANGASVLQLRDKTSSAKELFDTATKLKEACDKNNLPLLINDYVDITMTVNAAGVHVGQQDMDGGAIRQILKGDAIIGLSMKNENDLQHAPLSEIDYLSIGGVFPTTSKNNPEPPIGLDGLRDLTAKTRRVFDGPIIAIAGITLENAAQVIDAGVDGVAVISTIWDADEAKAALVELRKTVDAKLSERQTP